MSALDFWHPDFRPLQQHLGLNCSFDDDHHAACPMDDWMWMYRQAGSEFYKHVVTREYLRLPTLRWEPLQR